MNNLGTASSRLIRTSEMRRTFPFVLIYGLIFFLSVPGCEKSRTEQQLEQLMTSFLSPDYYLVSHEGFPIGSYVRAASINDDQEYEFRTKLTMPSANGLKLTTDSVYLFQHKSPYLLSSATRTTHAGDISLPYKVEILYPAENSEHELVTNMAEDGTYGLSEYFALELALMGDSGQPSTAIATTITPISDTSNTTSWEVVGRSVESIVVSSSSGDRATYSLKQGIPHLVSLVDDKGISLKKLSADEFVSLKLLPPHVVKEINVAVDRPIENPRTVSVMLVQFEFSNGTEGPWASLLDERSTLTSYSQPRARSSALLDWDIERKRVRDNDALKSIVADVVRDSDGPHQIVDALVAYVNQTITYKEWNMLQSVDETLVQKIGDCTELSQLFTALATTAGLTTRTVVGLAYQEHSQSFGIHAWNEIRFNDGTVRVVDPTWNQNFADATHIKFPSAYQHEIVQTLKNLSIKVLSVSYDT